MTLKISSALSTVALAALLVSCAKKAEEPKELYATIMTSYGPIVVRLFEDLTPKTVENFVGLATGKQGWHDPKQQRKSVPAGEDAATDKPAERFEPFYDGLTFHRVIKDFMIQGGDPLGDGSGGPGYQFEDETYRMGKPITGEITDKETAENVFETLLLPHLKQHRGQSPVEEVSALFQSIQLARSLDPMLGKTVESIQEALGVETPVRERELIHPVSYGTICMANAGPNTNGSQFFIVTNPEGEERLNGRHTVFGEVVQGMEVVETIENVETGAQDRPVEPVVIESITIERS